MLFCHRKNMDFLLTVFIGNEDQWENEDQPQHCWKTCWMKYLMKQQGIDGRSNAGNQWIPPESGFDIRTHGDIYIYKHIYIYITNSVLWLGLKRGDTSVYCYDMLWIYELSIGNRMIGTIPMSAGPVRLTWQNLARPSDSMNPWEQRPNQTGCISRWNNMIITLR